MRKIAKNKIFNGFVVLTTILWAVGIAGVLAPLFPASAAITVTSENKIGMSEMTSGTMVRDITSFKILGSSSETLNSIKIRFEDVGGSGATPSTMLKAFNDPAVGNYDQGLTVWKDANSNGWLEMGGSSADTIVDWEIKPTWTDAGGGVFTTTLDIANQALPASYSGNFNYFITMKMAATPAAGKSFKFTYATGAGNTIVTSAGSPNVTVVGTQPFNSMGSMGTYSSSPHVGSANYVNNQVISVTFDQDMSAASTDCNEGGTPGSCAKYTLHTAAAGDNEQIISATLGGANRVLIITAHADARISINPMETLTISNNPTIAPKAMAANMPYADNYPLILQQSPSNILISEVKLAGAAATDEFIELYNRFVSPVSLNGWKVKALRNNTMVTLATLPNVNIAPASYYLIANNANAYNNNVNGAGMVADAAYGGVDLQTGDAVFITQTVNTIDYIKDMVGFGTSKLNESTGSSVLGAPNTGTSVERKATWSSIAGSMADNTDKGNSYDSNDNGYDFVGRTIPDPQKSTSTAEVPSLVANQPPTINHMAIVTAIAGQELKVSAQITDEDSVGILTTKLCYKASNTSWPDSPVCVDGTKFMDYVFTLPPNALTAFGLDYYIYATDSASSTTYSAAGPSANATQAKSNAYHVSVSSNSGSRQIAGAVYQADCTTPISSATVKVEGTGYSGVSGADGVFTINNVPDGVYNLKATAAARADGTIWGVSVNLNNPQSSGWNFCLAGSTGESKSGTTTTTIIQSTAPMDGMSGAPRDITLTKAPIVLRTNNNIKQDTVNTSSVLLKKVVGGTVSSVAGYSVGIDIGSGISGSNFGGTNSNNVIVIYSSTLLDGPAEYLVEVLPGVTNSAGVSLSGNRPGGGFMMSFSTNSMNSSQFSGGGFQFSETSDMWTSNNFTSMTNDAAYVEMKSKFDTTSGKWEGGQYKPPFIVGVVPSPGQSNVATNITKIIIKFSDPIDTSSVNKGSFQLFNASVGETDVTASKISSVDLDASKTYVTMNVTGGLTAAPYKVKIKNGVRGTNGITIGPPTDPGGYFYKSEFTVGASSDSATPTITSSFPLNEATNVSMDFGYISFGLSEAIVPSRVNSANVILKSGNTTMPATVDYDIMGQKINIFPSSALVPGTKYTVQLFFGGTVGIVDLSGIPAAGSEVVQAFTMTTSADITKPKVEFANCDTYSCAVTFSKSMNSTKASASASNTNLWTKSALNPANYALTFGANGTGSTENLAASGVSFVYKPETSTVLIQGLAFTGATISTDSFVLTVTGVTDMQSNPIDTVNNVNRAKGKIKDKASTMGFIGPGSGGGFMGGSGEGMGVSTGGPTGFGSFKPNEAMTMGAMVMPMNMMSGATTTYIFDIPKSPGKSTDKLDDGSYIKLTFDKGKGFDLTNATTDSNNPMKQDLNGPGPSTFILKTSGVSADSVAATQGGTANDGIVVSSSNTLIVYLDSAGGTSGSPDRFHVEIKSIVNPSATQTLSSAGYTVDEKLYKADGTLVDSITSMPFFINSAGENAITANITAPEGSGTFKLMLGSPLTGPMDSDVTVNAGSASKTWSSLPNGCYFLFTEPTITLGVNKYQGQMKPDPICLPGVVSDPSWNSGTKTLTRTLPFVKFGAGNSASLTVKVSGTFKATGEEIDIFAGGPSGYTVETKTLTGVVTNNSTTLYLPANGTYMVGVGPAMSKGPKMSSGPMMTDWMPPKNVNISVSGVGATPAITRTDTGATITELSFTVGSASKQINGRVISKQTTLSAGYTGTATTMTVANASGFVSGDYITLYNGTTATAGKIASISGTTITLSSALGTNYSSGATVYNVIPNTNLWANQPMGFGGSGFNSTSNPDGSFTLKVADNGTYEIGAWKDGLGEAPIRSAVVKTNTGASDGNSTADVYMDGNLVTTANELLIKMYKPQYTISGKVMDANNNPIQYMHLMAQESTSKQTAHANTDASGSYVVNVGAGTWLISGTLPSATDACGLFTKTVVVSEATGSQTIQNISPSTSTCYTLSGSISLNGSAQANIPVMIAAWDATNDRPLGTYFRNEMTNVTGAYSVKVASGTYRVSIFTPDFGEIGQNVTVSADTTSNISYSSAQMKTLTIVFTGGAATMHGFVDVKSTTSPTRRGMPLSDLTSNKTVTVPAGTYKVVVFVEGLGDFTPASNIDLSATDQTVTINLSTTAKSAVSGTVKDASNNAVANAAIVMINATDGTTIQTTTDTNGAYSLPAVKNGDWNVIASQKNYSAPAKATVTVSGATVYDFDSDTAGETVQAVNNLVEKTTSISGTIYQADGTTPVTSGYVLATTSDGKRAKADIQGDGSYSLPVSSGAWTIKADAPLFSETTRSGTVSISADSETSKNISLTADAADLKKSDSTTVSPASGVIIDDSDNTGVEFSAGQGVLGRQTSATVTMEQIDMPTTDMATPVGSFVDITANASGNDLNQLGGDGAEITVHYTAAQLIAAGVTDESALKMQYYDETTDSYIPFSKQSCDTVANTCTATTDHLTPIGITASTLTVASSRRSDSGSSGSVAAPAPTVTAPATPVEEKKTESKKEETKTVVTEVTETVKSVVKEVVKEVAVKTVALTNVLPVKPAERTLKAEIGAIKDFSKTFKKAPATDKDWQAVNYLAYGTTDKTKSMTSVDRASLLDDYKNIYGKAPSTEKDWTDLAKIAQGSMPSRVLGQEAQAIKSFVNIFNRPVDFSNKAEEKFVHSVAYLLRPEATDMAKEKAAISAYKKAYKQTPSNSFAWAVVKAIAYSGVNAEVKKTAPVVEKPKAAAPATEAPVTNAVPAQPAASERNLKAELSAVSSYTKLAGKAPNGDGWKVVQFISYGSTDESKAKTAAERATIVKQFKSKYGSLPASDADWQKLAKLVK